MLHLACYDIENDKLRLKVADSLLAVGLERVQESVFMGSLDDRLRVQVVQEVTERLATANPASTRFLLMPLAEAYARDSHWQGDNAPDWAYHLNQTKTLIF